jgi:hypothetical protein
VQLFEKLQRPVDEVQISNGFLLNPAKAVNIKFTVLEWGEPANKDFECRGPVPGGFEWHGPMPGGEVKPGKPIQQRSPGNTVLENVGGFFVTLFLLAGVAGVWQGTMTIFTEGPNSDAMQDIGYGGFSLVLAIGILMFHYMKMKDNQD